MLRLLEKREKLSLSVSPMSIQIESLMTTYGFDTGFAFFWVQEFNGKISALVSKVDSNVIVAAEHHCNVEELKEFLCVIGFGLLTAEKEILQDLGFKIHEKGFIMTHIHSKQKPVCFPVSETEPPYRKIYELLKKPQAFGNTIPSYADWLGDLSARVRNKCARIVYREEEGKCVSCGMFTFESSRGAVIGAVATDVNFRGKGYASEIVKKLCAGGEYDGKEVFLMCAADKVSFYKKLDFETVGEFSLALGVYNE